MEITRKIEILLRGAGYETWPWTGGQVAVTCFENATLIGFVHVFSSEEELLASWESAQSTVLSRHSAALRAAGAKAWNVYSVFLAEEGVKSQQRAVERIEENFALTRKIARTGVRTQDDVERALLPLIAVNAQPMFSDTDFEDRLRSRLNEIPEEVLAAFLDSSNAEEVARMLVEKL